jgi:hypothetical protein
MKHCELCHDLVKRNDADERLAFEFTPEQINYFAFLDGCESCLVIFEGLRQSQSSQWSLKDVRVVLARCHDQRGSFQDTLRLEIFFIDDRPKLELEYYSLQSHGEMVAYQRRCQLLTRYKRTKASVHELPSAVIHSLNKQ